MLVARTDNIYFPIKKHIVALVCYARTLSDVTKCLMTLYIAIKSANKLQFALMQLPNKLIVNVITSYFNTAEILTTS